MWALQHSRHRLCSAVESSCCQEELPIRPGLASMRSTCAAKTIAQCSVIPQSTIAWEA